MYRFGLDFPLRLCRIASWRRTPETMLNQRTPSIFGDGYRDTLNYSRFVPTACPHEREARRMRENQNGPSEGRDGDVCLGFHGFCGVNRERPNPCSSDLKSVRSPDRRGSRPPRSALAGASLHRTRHQPGDDRSFVKRDVVVRVRPRDECPRQSANQHLDVTLWPRRALCVPKGTRNPIPIRPPPSSAPDCLEVSRRSASPGGPINEPGAHEASSRKSSSIELDRRSDCLSHEPSGHQVRGRRGR